MKFPAKALTWLQRPQLWLVAAILLVAVGAWEYRWTADDAMIDFRIVDNLVHGHGPVFNAGQRVEAYTNPLWVGLLALGRVILFFLPIGSVAVVVSLIATLSAVILASRFEQKSSVPIGLLILCALPVTWEFATSGLETSLAMLWIAASAILITRCPYRIATGVVLGLGPLVRPDLALMTGIFVVALLLQQRRLGPRASSRRLMAVALFGPVVVYEIFRTAYFGLLVSNTALTKSATSFRWSVGWRYLVDTVSPYWIAPVLVLLLAWWVWSQRTERRGWNGNVVRIALICAGSLHALYVVAIGGDFMHGRMLVPSLFAILIAIDMPQRSGSWFVGFIGAVYVIVLVTTLRYEQHLVTPTNFVADERLMEISLTKTPHPVNPSDMANSVWWRYGETLRVAHVTYANDPHGYMALATSPNAYFGIPPDAIRYFKSSHLAPGEFVAASRPIGQVGMAAGRDVMIFDQLSLANPVSSHFELTGPRNNRPGHEKVATFDWYLGQYGSPRLVWIVNYFQPSFRYEPVTSQGVRDAAAALHCGPLHRYLNSISAPLTPRRLASNMWHSLSWTTMSFSSNPKVARTQLCLR